jgi:predicted dehydrogenase
MGETHMLNVGIVGLGFMGRTHLKAWQELGTEARVAAVCESNPDAIAGIGVAAGNLEKEPSSATLEGVEVYNDFGEMIEQADLDAVSITLPTHMHPEFTVRALEKGLHVLCEKPMALTLEECDRMIEAASKAGKTLMVAHCIRFWPEYIWLKHAIDTRAYGEVRVADFYRLGTAPGWGDASWFSDPGKSGGVTMDLHIHDVDFVRYVFGAPSDVSVEGACFENGCPGHVRTSFNYGDGRLVSATGSWMMAESCGFRMGYRVICDSATIEFDSQEEEPLRVYNAGADVVQPELPEGDGYTGEVRHFAELISGSNQEPVITCEDARESVCLALSIQERT